jgi:hypothetical protein
VDQCQHVGDSGTRSDVRNRILGTCCVQSTHTTRSSSILSSVLCVLQVWDKDVVTEDDMIGRASWAFAPREVSRAADRGERRCLVDSSEARILPERVLT